MRIQSTAGFKKIVKDLAAETGHSFQRAIYNLLFEVWGEIQYAPDLTSRLDRSGIDLYMGDEPDFQLVVQCKGIQAPIESQHLKKAIGSIRKFMSSSYTAQEYWIVFNRPLPDLDFRAKLESELDVLVSSGSAAKAEWMDPSKLLMSLFHLLRDRFKNDIPSRNRTRLETYSTAMRSGRAYMPDVPFTHYVRHWTANHGRKNPAKVRYTSNLLRRPLDELSEDLAHRLPSRRTTNGAVQRSAFRFLLSEFGFGKTSLLLELGLRLTSANRPAIYVPVAELPRNAFKSEYLFLQAVFSSLYPAQAEEVTTAKYIPLQIFRWVLRASQQFVLILDGLDEHRESYTLEGVTQMFRALRDLACDTVISARREFWDSNKGNLELAMKGSDHDREIYILDDWDTHAMLAYLGEFPASPGLEHMREVISTGRYKELYGDIPQRPLFLEMLVEATGDEPLTRVRLSELYRICLERKLERDLSSPFETSNSVLRPLPSEFLDLAEIRKRILLMLTELAGSLAEVEIERNRLLLKEVVTDTELLSIASNVGLDSTSSSLLMLHSVLVPTGGHDHKGNLLIRFAHRSYQEYFLAQYLSIQPLHPSVSIPPLVAQLLEEFQGTQNLLSASPQTGDSFLF